MVSNAFPSDFASYVESLSFPTATTSSHDPSNSVNASYAMNIAGPGVLVRHQHYEHRDSPSLSPSSPPKRTTIPLPQQESHWGQADGIREGIPRPGLRLTIEPAASESSNLLSPLESDWLALPSVPASPCWTSEPTTPDAMLKETPVSPSLLLSPFMPPSRRQTPPPKFQPLSPLPGYSSLRTFSSPDDQGHSTPMIERQSSITDYPPESESRFIRPHPTDENHNPWYYMQRTRFTQQQPIDLPSQSLQSQSGQSQFASEFESVVDSSSAVEHNFTTEFSRYGRDPIVHSSRLRKLSDPMGSGRPMQHAPSFRKSTKRPSTSLPEDSSPAKKACVRSVRN